MESVFVDHVLSELSTITRWSWVALRGMAHSFIELDKTVVHVIRFASECPGISSRGMGWWWPAAGLGALNVAVHAWNLLKEVAIIFITSTIV